jgi:hypothetical protein
MRLPETPGRESIDMELPPEDVKYAFTDAPVTIDSGCNSVNRKIVPQQRYAF